MTEVLSLLMTVLFEVKKLQGLVKQGSRTGKEQYRDEWVDGQQAMQMLNVSPRFLQSLRDTRVLPYTRLRSKLYYRVDDIAKALESNYHYKPAKIDRHDFL